MTRRQLLTAAFLLVSPLVFWGVARLVPADVDPASQAPPPADARVAPPPRAEDDLAGLDLPDDVRELLRSGRSWRAARRLRELPGVGEDPRLTLLAAKAEAGWGAWGNVRGLLDGEAWLDSAGGGDGWYLLGRAREEARDWPGAADAYGRYLRARPDTVPGGERTVGDLRSALALLRAGRVDEGVRALERLRPRAPAISGWVATLAAEALAARADTARVRALLEAERDLPVPLRAHRARLSALRAANDARGARALAVALRERSEDPALRAGLTVEAARAALAMGDTAGARRELRSALSLAPGDVAAVDAARIFTSVGGLAPADQLAVGAVYDRHRNAARAAAGYRAWLAAGAGTADEQRDVRLRMGRALFTAGQHAEAVAALRPLFDAAPDVAAEAMFYAGRAQFRSGQRGAAVATWETAARRFPGAPAAGDGLFLAADAAHDDGQTTRAAQLYRQAGSFQRSPRAGMALMRLGGLAFLARDYAGAARIYDEYRSRYPQGDLWLQATYWAGRSHFSAGDRETGRGRWREVRSREPLSYYAVKAAERLDERFWPVALADAPRDEAVDAARVAGWMLAVDLLRAAGLDDEAAAEADRRVREAGDRRALLYPLAEALNQRGFTAEGTRIGRALRAAGGSYDMRQVRILYPFPYREIITAEAREKGLDPFLVAALIRQESTFRARVVSGAGARGLMQVMPATGRGLASGAGIRNWSADLLFDPEINVSLGTRFLAAQMRAYDGHLPSVFTAYNAGPGRVRRWRSFPEYARDGELFTERIPFDETRDYVKILIRNMAIYRGVYGG